MKKRLLRLLGAIVTIGIVATTVWLMLPPKPTIAISSDIVSISLEQSQTIAAGMMPATPVQAVGSPGKPAYQVLIPNGVGSETGLKVFPSKLQISGKDNWLAVQSPDGLDVPVGAYTYDAQNDPISVNKYSGAIKIDSATNSLVITAGALSEKCKYNIEITNYALYGGEIAFNVEKNKSVVSELRAKFRSYVYGSGSDFYQLEDTPQNQEIVKHEIAAVRVYAVVKGTGTASTRILVNTKKYNGTDVALTSVEQRIGITYITNPATGLPWTWADIDNLQAGVTLNNGECSYVYVEVELVVHSQTFFPITPVEVTPGTAGSWQDVNVSAYVPAGATGVILRLVHNTNDLTQWAVGLRKNGSSDNRTGYIQPYDQSWAAIGVDSNRIFEAYVGSTTSIDIYLVGYTMSGVTFFTNAYDKSLTTTGVWTDIDCHTEAPNAIGLIFEFKGATYLYGKGLRKNGSTDGRIQGAKYHNTFGAIIGCDAGQIIEGYIEDTEEDLFLVGYITDGATFNTNATDVSLGTTDSWLDLAALPAGAVMGFIEVTGDQSNFGLRKNGSSEEILGMTDQHLWAFVECDASYIIEGKIASTTTDFFVVGYATAPTAPTITISAASLVEATTATLNGNVTATGGENPTVTCYWGTVDHPGTPTGWDYNGAATYAGGIAAFTKAVTSLPSGTTIYFTASATNSGGTSWPNASLSFLTKPAAPTNVSATDGTYTTKVTITWTKSTGATGYKVYRGTTNDSGTLGDVATYDDTAAGAPTITLGTATATNGSSTSYVTCTLSGQSTSDGSMETYTVYAYNATGWSSASTGDAGHRGTTTLTFQWQRSDADSDADYNTNIGTTNSYNDIGAPAPSVTPGTASATNGTYASKVILSLSGYSANIGSKRYFRCVVSMSGAAPQGSTGDEGWIGVGTLTYQWFRSAADSDGNYSEILNATTSSYDDTGGVTDPDGRYYKCALNATGAYEQGTNGDRGYMSVDVGNEPIVATVGVTEITTISAILLGSLNSLGTYSTVDVYFQYSLTGAFAGEEIATTADTKTVVGSFNKQILNLTSNTTYFYRARANYSTSSYVNGAILTFGTSATHSPTTPTAPTTNTPTPYPGQTYVIRLGPTVAGWLDNIGALFGTDGKGFGGGLTFVLIMIIWLWLSSKGYPVAGGALTLPIQLGSAYIGLWEWAFVGVIVFLLATVWIYKTWFEK